MLLMILIEINLKFCALKRINNPEEVQNSIVEEFRKFIDFIQIVSITY